MGLRDFSKSDAKSDYTAFEAGVRARLFQSQQLTPAERQGVARLGRLVQVLRRKQRWSLETLAAETGLPWLWLALLEQGVLLPEELTPATVEQLGGAFPLEHGGADPTVLFGTLAATLRQLQLPLAPAPASPDSARTAAVGRRLVRWLSPPWHPPFAGEVVTAAGTASQEEIFHLDEGWIRVTCRWWAASPEQPAVLWLAWYADLTLSGDFWVRFTRRNDPSAVLAEKRLGGALSGEVGWPSDELGFDPTNEPWALTFVLAEPTKPPA